MVASFFLARRNRAIRASRSRLTSRQHFIESRISRREKECTIEINASRVGPRAQPSNNVADVDGAKTSQILHTAEIVRDLTDRPIRHDK